MVVGTNEAAIAGAAVESQRQSEIPGHLRGPTSVHPSVVRAAGLLLARTGRLRLRQAASSLENRSPHRPLFTSVGGAPRRQ